MSGIFIAFHYLMWAFLVVTAIVTLRAYRGVSLLSIWSLCFAIQVGMGFALARDAGLVELSFEAMHSFGVSLIISYAILIAFLLLLYSLRNRRVYKGEVSTVTITRTWKVLGCVLAIVTAYLNLVSNSGLWALRNGWRALSENSYYEARVELIDVQASGASRIGIYGGAIANALLTVMLVVAAVELARRRTLENVLFSCVLAASLLVAALLSMQKSLVFMVLAAIVVPFVLSMTARKRRGGGSVVMIVGGVAALLLSIGALLYSVTEGYSMEESFWKVVSRIFLMPAYGSAAYCHVYPNLEHHTYWMDLRPVRLLLSNNSFPSTGESVSVNVAVALTGMRFNANASFLGVSWAAAGYWGVAVGASFVAVYSFITDRLVERMPRSVSTLPLGIYYWLGFIAFGNGPFLVCVIHLGLWMVPLYYYYFVAGRGTRLPCNRSDMLILVDEEREKNGIF